MPYNVFETDEAIQDVNNFAIYILKKFKNKKAAYDFLAAYDKEVRKLELFPNGYRGIGLEHKGYEIRIKPFGTYNIFFIVQTKNQRVIIIRVLKDRQNWSFILREQSTYYFDE